MVKHTAASNESSYLNSDKSALRKKTESFETSNVFNGEIRRKFDIDDFLISAIKHRPPKSAWLENEKAFYRDMLKGSKYDVLVVPFQTQKKGVDLIGRMLMSYRLAASIEQNTSLNVAPLDLLYPSLGQLSRFYDENEVLSLAKDLGVTRIIWGYAGTHIREIQDNKNKSSHYKKKLIILIFA